MANPTRPTRCSASSPSRTCPAGSRRRDSLPEGRPGGPPPPKRQTSWSAFLVAADLLVCPTRAVDGLPEYVYTYSQQTEPPPHLRGTSRTVFQDGRSRGLVSGVARLS